MADGKDSGSSLTNFDDIDEEDKAGRKTRLFKRNETQGYVDTASLDAASVDKASNSKYISVSLSAPLTRVSSFCSPLITESSSFFFVF